MPKSRRQKRRIAAEIRAQLVDAFPACFKGEGEDKPPLKLGIDADILERLPVAGWKLTIALGDYTCSPTYQRNLVEGADRIDLDGNPAGKVTAEQAERAAARMRKFENWNSASAPPAAA